MNAHATVEEYLSSLEAPQRAELERIRALIRTTVPDAVESISYDMPAFKYKNKPLMYYATFKNHYSVFPTSSPTQAIAEKLIDFQTGKGTLQFTDDKPLPDEIIVELLLIRVAQIDA